MRSTKTLEKIICSGIIINLYLGKIKKHEKIIILAKKTNIKYLNINDFLFDKMIPNSEVMPNANTNK